MEPVNCPQDLEKQTQGVILAVKGSQSKNTTTTKWDCAEIESRQMSLVRVIGTVAQALENISL